MSSATALNDEHLAEIDFNIKRYNEATKSSVDSITDVITFSRIIMKRDDNLVAIFRVYCNETFSPIDHEWQIRQFDIGTPYGLTRLEQHFYLSLDADLA